MFSLFCQEYSELQRRRVKISDKEKKEWNLTTGKIPCPGYNNKGTTK